MADLTDCVCGHALEAHDPGCDECECIHTESELAVAGERHTFNDPISGQDRVLVMGDENSRPYDGTHGVEHPTCDRLADVSPDLDAWYCPGCQAGGRISGAWFMTLWVKDDT